MFSMEITRLIERCRQGDTDALGELYKAYAKKMRGVCRRYISDEQVINDVLHDAFVIIFTSFDKLRDDRKAEAWMMSITRNVASKYKDHLMARPFVPLEEAESLPEPEAVADVRGVPLEDVQRLIERLPERYGQVFRLSVFEGLSHKELAAMLGIEPHSSSSQLARAKRMLRGMMQRYWVALLLLLIPIAMYLSREEKPVTEEKKPATVKVIDTVTLDTLSNMIAQRQNISETIKSNEQPDTAQVKQEMTVSTIRPEMITICPEVSTNRIKLPQNDITNLQPEKSKKQNRWHLALAYAGTPSSDMNRIDNYMMMPSFSDTSTRSARLYNWGDYMDYATQNADKMDSVDASNMNRIAIINANNPWEPIYETKHHERPKTYQFSLSKQLSSHWSLTTGLGYTYMKSTFEAGNDMTLIRRVQKLHYIGLPLHLTYRIAGGKRWTLYASGGIQLDIPVSGRLTTQYLYNGSAKNEYPDSLIIPTSHNSIRVPWQWSVGVGAGVQYQILPHINAYIGPSLHYYIPTSGDTENYRTEHPFDLSLPFGIRFTW